MAKSASSASKPATQALSSVVRDIDSAIKAMIDSISNLVDVELPAGWEQGLDTLGQFFKTAVAKVYDWFDDDAKKKIKEISKYLEPVTNLFRMLSIDLSKAVPNTSETFEADVEQRFQQIEKVGIYIMDYLRKIADRPLWVEALGKAAEIVDNVVSVFKMLSIDLSNAGEHVANLSLDDLALQVGQVESVGIYLMNYLRKITANPDWVTALEDAAAIAANVVKIFDILKIELSNAGKYAADLSLDDLGTQLSQVELIGVEIMNYLRKIASKPEWVAALKEAAAIADNVSKVFGIINISFENFTVPKQILVGEVQRFFSVLENMGRYTLDYLRKIAANPDWTKALAEAAVIADNVLKVFKVIEISFESFTVPKQILVGEVERFFSVLEGMGRYIMDYLRKISDNPEWSAALADAAVVADNVLGVFDILNIDFSTTEAGAGFMTRLNLFITNLKEAAPVVKKGIQDVASEWENVEKIAADAQLVESLIGVFEFLSLSEMLEGVQRQTSLSFDEYTEPLIDVVNRLFTDLETVTPLIKTGLEKIDDLWDGAIDTSQSIAEKIAGVFGGIASAIHSAVEITDVDNWNLDTLLQRIADLGVALSAIYGMPSNMTLSASGITTGAPLGTMPTTGGNRNLGTITLRISREQPDGSWVTRDEVVEIVDEALYDLEV